MGEKVKLSQHASRILVAVVGIPALVVSAWLGGIFFLVVVEVILLLCLWEFYRLAQKGGVYPIKIPGFLFAGLGGYLFFCGVLGMFIPLLLIYLIMIVLWGLWQKKGSVLANLTVSGFGAIYLTLFLGSLLLIRENFKGDYWLGGMVVIFAFASIWICDTFAFYGGKAMGKKLLAPSISPKKTVEGAVLGMLGALLTSLGGWFVLKGQLSPLDCLVVGLVVGSIGQLGDLVESKFKRAVGVKDTSDILAGHGGFLDRFDSLALTAPTLYLYFWAVGRVW